MLTSRSAAAASGGFCMQRKGPPISHLISNFSHQFTLLGAILLDAAVCVIPPVNPTPTRCSSGVAMLLPVLPTLEQPWNGFNLDASRNTVCMPSTGRRVCLASQRPPSLHLLRRRAAKPGARLLPSHVGQEGLQLVLVGAHNVQSQQHCHQRARCRARGRLLRGQSAAQGECGHGCGAMGASQLGAVPRGGQAST